MKKIQFEIQIKNSTGKVIGQAVGQEECRLVYAQEYHAGDTIVIKSSEDNIYLNLCLDDVLGHAFIYLKTKEFVYQIPFGEQKISYSPKAFSGDVHLLEIRLAEEEEVKNCINLACNIYDQHGDHGLYPHAYANVETRGESVFAARNAIDGNRNNYCHGQWPFESWGINMQDDAWLEVDFGREVSVYKIKLYTRSDFPHDSWWTKVTLSFSDGSSMDWELEKSNTAHVLYTGEKRIHSLRIHNLIKADDPSPFPALSQIEVYGRNIESV